MTNVLIVDDAITIRTLYKATLDESDEYKVVGTLENANAALPFCMRNPVDLVLMDVYTKDKENGLKAAGEIKKELPHIKIIIATSLPECSFIEKARECGCESFWYKELGQIELIEIADRTMAGESVYPDASPAVSVGSAKSVEFTATEMKVLRELCDGKLNKEIADELYMSENTVKFHIANMLQKAGYSNRYQLAIDAVEQKLIVPGF